MDFSSITLTFTITYEPVYNDHPRDLKKAAVRQRCLIKLRFRLAVDGSNWPLLTGGLCSQVVVKSGLTVRTLFSSSPNDNIDEYADKFVELIGWGAKETTGKISESLKRISLTVFPMR